jgi:hypothetical protein
MFMQAVAFKEAFHSVNVPVFSLYRHARDPAEIVGMIIIGRNTIKEMEMKTAYPDHIPGISDHSVAVAFRTLAFKFVFVQMKPHTNLLFVSSIIFCTITAFIIDDAFLLRNFFYIARICFLKICKFYF